MLLPRFVVLIGILGLVPIHLLGAESPSGKSAPERRDVLVLDNGMSEADVERRPYRDYVADCADSLLRDGLDHYGPIHQPLLVSTLDVRTHTFPEVDQDHIEPWLITPRGEGLARLRGCECLVDQPTVEVFYLLSEQRDNPKYAQTADAYLRGMMSLACKKGLFWWGWHRYYDVDRDIRGTSKGMYHEIHVIRPRWERLWQVNPTATAAELDAIWQWHIVNKETGEHNRHADQKRGRSFPMSGGEFVYALAFRYSKTHDPEHLRQARLVADFHWKRRDPETNLLPGQSSVGLGRFDGRHMDTSVTGIYCYFLLKSYELTGVDAFRNQALAYLKAYARYGYDPKTGQFFGSLRLDGTPEPGPRATKGYAASEARGYIDLWEPESLGYEAPIYTAQVYAYAYQLTKDPVMLETARKWAEWIRRAPPSEGCLVENARYSHYAKRFSRYGTYAGKYGRTISLFLHLYALTGEQGYLDDAKRLAREAVAKLYYNELFRGHPAATCYCSLDGVGFLLYALLQLDAVEQQPEKIVGAKSIPLAGGGGTMTFDNW